MKRIDKWKEQHIKAKSFSDASIELTKKKLSNSKELKKLQEIDSKFFQIDAKNYEHIPNFKGQELPKVYEQKLNQNNHTLNLLKSEIFELSIQPFFQKKMFFPIGLEEENKNLKTLINDFKTNLENVELNFNKLLSTINTQKKLMKKNQSKLNLQKKNITIEEINIFNESLGFKTHQINETTNFITNNFKPKKTDDDFAKTTTLIICVGVGLLILWLVIWFLGGR